MILVLITLLVYMAAVFVEKVLRVQPNVKKLYLLLRAADAKSATQRLHNEVIYMYIYRQLRIYTYILPCIYTHTYICIDIILCRVL